MFQLRPLKVRPWIANMLGPMRCTVNLEMFEASRSCIVGKFSTDMMEVIYKFNEAGYTDIAKPASMLGKVTDQ